MLVQLAGPEDLDEVYALRHEVFVVGQHVPPELERDELDATAVHAVARCDGAVVGTGRLVAPSGPGQAAVLGRLAVRQARRGTGVGAALLALFEACAVERGWPVLELHAQTSARGFYERYGYSPYGPVYLEAGLEHVSMRKVLSER